MSNSKIVHLYTDGSCLGNPGPGGYGAVLEYGQHHKELSQGYHSTTNNRMEMLATIAGLKALKRPCQVVLTTDSQYVKQGVEKWMARWKQNGWRTAAKKAVKNKDLWQQLDKEINRHDVTWKWIKGHSGHRQNEQCDELARNAATHGPFIDDKGFSAD